ncbi:hypothetical protein SAMN02910289_00920 [Lachnospiraceae bacterium RM5]|nr:hypothetical protein SAMN02910289_00920 [Lachnospiraceae bacterium RM5]
MNERMNNKKLFKTLIAVVIVILLFIFISENVSFKRKAVSNVPDPVQEDADGGVTKKIGGYDVNINFLYSYDIKALVVHTKDYNGSDIVCKLSPRDFALAWGKVAEYNDRINFHWSQSNRWYYWNVDSYDEIAPVGGEDGVAYHSANNHIIPADKSVKKLVKKVKTGDYIRMKGYLVSINARNSNGATFNWNSSTTREDTGDGACEVFYVTDLEWLE